MTEPAAQDVRLRERALKQLKKRRDFMTHLLFYVMSNSFVVVLWFLTEADGFFWPGVLMAFWGIGLVMNAWDVWHGDTFTEAQIAEEIDRLRSTK
jgi:hypothetical protein